MHIIRKLIAGIIGFPLLVLGIILIPIPGPGVLVCLIALFILSFGFSWAQSYLDKCKQILQVIFRKARERADRIEHKKQ